MSPAEVLVLPGVGSPESPRYRAVYALLETEAQRRGMAFRCLKYEGHGHLAKGSIVGEMTLSGVAQAIAEEVRRAPLGSLVICRSFGCLLPGYLALNHAIEWGRVSRIAFWGPVPYFEMWRLFGTAASLAAVSAEAEAKGARFTSALFESIVPLEISCEVLADTEVVIAVGTKDVHTSSGFGRHLEAIIGESGKAEVKFREVIGGAHEVTMAHDEDVRTDYLNALFA